MHRLQCTRCGCLWWPRLPFVKGKTRYTRSFALTVLDLLQFGTIRAVAEYLRVSWDLVKEIHKTWLAVRYRAIDLSEVWYLGIDEFSLKKRHPYMTIFVDLQSGRILHAIEDTSKEAISPFLRIVAKKAQKLKAVTTDMSTSYTNAVREHLPDIPIVFDRYHVMALINRQIVANMQGLLGYYPHKIINALLEGLNNKIKTMKRQAYGFRDMEYFKLRLYNLHNSRYAFAG